MCGRLATTRRSRFRTSRARRIRRSRSTLTARPRRSRTTSGVSWTARLPSLSCTTRSARRLCSAASAPSSTSPASTSAASPLGGCGARSICFAFRGSAACGSSWTGRSRSCSQRTRRSSECARRPSASRLRALVLFELPVQRRRSDRELLGGLHLVAAVRAHDRDDVVALDFIERPHAARLVWLRCREGELLGQVLEIDAAPPCEHHGALDRVLELANVPRPTEAHELVR